MSDKKRTYIDFDPKTGYPAGDHLFYECHQCHEILPSSPPDSTYCKCWNIMIDIDYGRITIRDHKLAKLFSA
jgi:hypothetical protein